MERLDELRRSQLVRLRLDYLVRHAWHSIAKERGYTFDSWLATSSHGTLAVRTHNFARGV